MQRLAVCRRLPITSSVRQITRLGSLASLRAEPASPANKGDDVPAIIAKIKRTRIAYPTKVMLRFNVINLSVSNRIVNRSESCPNLGYMISNATVNRSPDGNGRVPCHIVDGNSTSRPGLGSTICVGPRPRASAAGGSPSVSQPTSLSAFIGGMLT